MQNFHDIHVVQKFTQLLHLFRSHLLRQSILFSVRLFIQNMQPCIVSSCVAHCNDDIDDKQHEEIDGFHEAPRSTVECSAEVDSGPSSWAELQSLGSHWQVVTPKRRQHRAEKDLLLEHARYLRPVIKRFRHESKTYWWLLVDVSGVFEALALSM